jgi:hypothetical protein
VQWGAREEKWKMINLNDILQFDNLENVKIRFNLQAGGNWNPIEMFNSNEIESLLDGHYWNYPDKKSYKEGQITVGLVTLNKKMTLGSYFTLAVLQKT